MKPPKFDYVAPTTVAEAVDALARHNGDARPLSGGQSLVPMLNFRLATPSMLVDLCRIGELSGISISASEVSVGATTRTARLLDKAIEESLPGSHCGRTACRASSDPQQRHRWRQHRQRRSRGRAPCRCGADRCAHPPCRALGRARSFGRGVLQGDFHHRMRMERNRRRHQFSATPLSHWLGFP